jgi:hypothetical protein
MKKIIVLALCIITLGTLNSCKKYEDGPAFSLRSKKSRVAAEWNVKKYTYGGVDVLTEKNDDVMFCNTGDPVNYSESITYTYTFDLTKEGDITLTVVVSGKMLDYISSYSDCDDVYETVSESEVLIGSWEFASDKEKLQIIIDGDIQLLDIKELREKSMKLEGIIDGEMVVMELEKK